jgi:EAL domain-containing protein (putative c-di-GMP-specific phosphodiesterase class I)
VTVNIAARQLIEPAFPDDVAAILDATGLPGSCLELEIDEKLLMADTALVLERLGRLRELGVRVSVDDFGGGFSSLSYLGKVPLDVLKIAKTFVDTTDGRPGGSRVSEAIVALAHSLHLSVVAEGIERPGQLAELTEIGCDAGQGYYFARPMDAAGIDQLIARDVAARSKGARETRGRAVAATAY